MTRYTFGIYEETIDGKQWTPLFSEELEADTQAELHVRNAHRSAIPTDLDGNERKGLYIRRGGVEWFCQFSA